MRVTGFTSASFNHNVSQDTTAASLLSYKPADGIAVTNGTQDKAWHASEPHYSSTIENVSTEKPTAPSLL